MRQRTIRKEYKGGRLLNGTNHETGEGRVNPNIAREILEDRLNKL